MLHYLFGFSGRINRAKIWLFILLVIVFWIVLGIALGVAVAMQNGGHDMQNMPPEQIVERLGVFLVVGCVFYLLALWAGLAVSTKRLHDRNKSAWWLLVFFALPLILQIPALQFMPTQFAHLADVMRAARDHLPPPALPAEPPIAVIGRGAATLIGLWAFVELYILRGTEGDNRYGPDPLAGKT